MDRSEIMRRVRSMDTAPEMVVRQLCHALGYRYRLHRSDLPGKPDLAFSARHKVIFVHGCFWHGHDCKRGARIPKNNREYWIKKISRNRERDQDNQNRLNELGWKNFVVWECEIKSGDLADRLHAFLGPTGNAASAPPNSAARSTPGR